MDNVEDFNDEEENSLIEEEEEGLASDEEDSSSQVPKKRRGRAPGTKIGPRLTIWSCAYLDNGTIKQERYYANSNASDEAKQKFSEEDARIAFMAKHGNLPASVDGPFLARKDSFASSIKKKDVIVADPNEYELGLRHPQAVIFHGWKGNCYDVKILNPEKFKTTYGVLAQETVFFISGEAISPENKRKHRPPPGLVLISSLETVSSQESITTN